MIGVVLAGGASTRFAGKPKGLLNLAGRPMALRIADTLSTLCETVVIEAPHEAGYDGLGLRVIHAPAAHAGKGPLAALVAGLQLVEDDNQVAFAPCDMPLLTPEIFRKLAGHDGVGAYARTRLGVEPLVAVLRMTLRKPLLTALELPSLPRTHVVLDAAGVQAIDFADTEPFANVNTPDDLLRAEARLRHADK